MSEETTIEKEIDLSKDAQKVIDTVEKMTVLELSQLVKALEDKFGVVAASCCSCRCNRTSRWW